jgi:cell division protein FtsW
MFGILQGNGNNLPPGFGGKRDLSNRLGRGDRSPLSIWFWELDRVLLSLILVLIAIGLIAVAASAALSVFRRPMSAVRCAICRCRFESDTWSLSTTPIVPTPAAAR